MFPEKVCQDHKGAGMIKKLFKIFLLFLALLILFTAFQWSQTKRKLAAYCRETTAGSSLAGARERALREGFRFIDSSSDGGGRRTALVTASGVMGRIVCEIEHDGDRVIKASLNKND